ncbi:MAG TPA: Rne/Rng family ribonuclease [Nocardioidaceae bacterium]|nr:Rne/Rng family ribonuclease [Nocardioidaceae bacterium]
MLDAENPAETTDVPASTAGEGGDAVPTDLTGTAGSGAEEAPAPAKKAAAKRTAAKKAPAKKAAAKKTAAKRTTKKAVSADIETPAAEPTASEVVADDVPEPIGATAPEAVETTPAEKKTAKKAAKKAPAKRASKKAAAMPETRTVEGASEPAAASAAPSTETTQATTEEPTAEARAGEEESARTTPAPATALLFQPPDPTKAVVTRRRRSTKAEAATETAPETEAGEEAEKSAKKAAKKPAKQPAKARPEVAGEGEEPTTEAVPAGQEPGEDTGGEGEEEQGGERRRRRRGGRRRRRSGGGDENGSAEGTDESREAAEERPDQGEGQADEGEESGAGTRRRRRRRRAGESGEGGPDEPENTVTRVRKPRSAEDEITSLSGSTRLEAKKQRRREGREAGRRRAPIVSEAEFLARRESVDRVMVIRQREDLTQIAVLEDKVLVEHYVSRESQTSLIGNVYLGRVQNVLPSMEAAFIDIGKGRNAVLYAGEVNWDALGAKNGSPRKIEAVLKSGQSILVQVTKDPIGHKGARLTSQISLPGRFLVYVPDGTTSGISRKLPDTERNRLKTLLKEIVPDSAGVIVRTAAEGASEEELTRDVERLTARWADIESKVSGGNAPQLLYGEPDLTLKVVRDLFTEDFKKLVIAGDDAWDLVEGYVTHVAPDLADRLEKYDGERDVFAEYRIDEQIEKALDRKVWLPSGGSLVIDRTEAMTVVDVNTGKFTGSGGNLEETVTKNNLEAAEEIVRQLRLRDIGGIIVVDFIDMVLESNRDLVLRRMVECLGRDRTRHQVAEVTSLGLVQMTRKRIGTGLLEAFSESCEHCQGRGLITHHEPVEPKKKGEDESRRGRRGRGRGGEAASNGGGVPSPKDVAAMAKPEEQAEEKAAKPNGREPEAEGAETPSEETQAEAAVSGRGRGGRGRGGRGRGGKDSRAEQEQEAASEKAGPAVDAEQALAGSASEPTEQTATAAQEEPAAEEKVSTPHETPAEPTSGEEGAGAPKGEAEASAEAAPAEPSAPAAPKIVTSVRRRGARRAAGPPQGAQASAPAGPSAPAVTTTVSAAADGSAADEVSDEPADVEPLATLLDAAEVDSPVDRSSADVDGTEGDGAAAEPPATPHVPVKKRGSRRR